MRLFHSLFARLSIALLGIVSLTGGAFFAVELYSTRHYHEEITQRLNASIAMYVTGERQLIQQGAVNHQALELLAQQAMVINPTVEVYLLDPAGNIVAHPMPDSSLLTRRVDLQPIQALISGTATMPLRGTDPRSERQKVFSAHPVMENGAIQGYLYAILGGQKYDELASSIRGSYVQTVSLWAMLAIASTVFLIGLLVLGLLTRRLGRLTNEVQAFADSGFDTDQAQALLLGSDAGPEKDEIGRLRHAFAGMAGKIRQQVEDLKETDRLRRELISNVSHDLRTPLASMHGYVETLLIKNDSLSADERQHYLEITRKHSTRLSRLIGDLFELSKLESASITPQPETFSLAELLQDVSQEFQLQAEQKGLSLKIDGNLEQCQVVADIGLMQRVLENLVRNAIRYTPAGGEVCLSVEPKPNAVAVSVADTGCGIAADELERVFDRFYRSAQSPHPRDEGSAGLGLAIVQKILDLHGSRITVTSQLNQGTVFAFDLPAQQAA